MLHRSGRTYCPGSAANDVGANNNLCALPPLVCDSMMRMSVAEFPPSMLASMAETLMISIATMNIEAIAGATVDNPPPVNAGVVPFSNGRSLRGIHILPATRHWRVK